MKNRGKGRERWRPSGAWNIFILFLSAYVILALIIGYSLPQDSQIARFLRFGDAVACAFFLADVFMRFMAAEDRVGFWKYGWIDLVSSIPNIAPLRWGRLYNFLRFIRALRAIRATMRISEYFFEDKLKNTFAFIASLTFACVAISGVLVLHFEKNAPRSNNSRRIGRLMVDCKHNYNSRIWRCLSGDGIWKNRWNLPNVYGHRAVHIHIRNCGGLDAGGLF